jgi:DNA-binding NarL/FixJ family response regulator
MIQNDLISKNFYENANVLLVDDEESLLQITSQNLGEMVKNIFTARNGYEALKVLELNPIDVAIIDLKMPGMDGFKLLEEMKNKNLDTISYVMTAFGDKESIKKAFRSKAQDYLEKPVKTDLLIQKLHEGWAIKNKIENEHISRLQILNEIKSDLKNEKERRNEKEIAFKEVLREIESAKKEVTENIALNIEKNIKPLIRSTKKLAAEIKNEKMTKILACLNNMEKEVDSLNSGFYKKLISYKYMLSPCETRICKLIHSGLILKEIGTSLGISENTVKNHVKNIKKKMGINGKRKQLKDYLNNIIE